MTIHAFTQSAGPLPAYINLQEVTQEGFMGPEPAVLVSVRTRGEERISQVTLAKEQALDMARDIAKHYGYMLGVPLGTACPLPPAGWYCARLPGHDGPCAAHPIVGERHE